MFLFWLIRLFLLRSPGLGRGTAMGRLVHGPRSPSPDRGSAAGLSGGFKQATGSVMGMMMIMVMGMMMVMVMVMVVVMVVKMMMTYLDLPRLA